MIPFNGKTSGEAVTMLGVAQDEVTGQISVAMILRDWVPGEDRIGVKIAVDNREAAVALIDVLRPFVDQLEDAYIDYMQTGRQDAMRSILQLATNKPAGKA